MIIVNASLKKLVWYCECTQHDFVMKTIIKRFRPMRQKMNDFQFISIVKEYELLYKINIVNESEQLKLWEELAKNFQLQNGHSALKKWQQLTENYILYLRGGDNESFPYSEAMQFIQPYLIDERQTEGSHSDLEMDETELERILYSDEELEPNDIDSHAQSTEPNCKRSNIENNIEVKKEEVFESREILQNASNLPANEPFPKEASPTALSSLSSLELIFLGYARELQKMPLSLKLQTKRKIADIMNEAEMQVLTN